MHEEIRLLATMSFMIALQLEFIMIQCGCVLVIKGDVLILL